MVGSLITMIGAFLTVWAEKEKHKYVDQLLQIKTDWYAEFNKPLAERNTAVLDNLEQQLRILSETLASAVGTAGAGTGP